GEVLLWQVAIEGRQRHRYGTEHCHWMCVARKARNHVRHGWRNSRAGTKRAIELLEFSLVWEVAVNQKVRDFDEVRRLRELFDWVTTVAQDAFFAVEKRNGRSAGRRIHKAVIVSYETRLGSQLTDVD